MASRRNFTNLEPKFQVVVEGIIDRQTLNSQGHNSLQRRRKKYISEFIVRI